MEIVKDVEVVPAGGRWPSGRYSEVALLDIQLDDISGMLEAKLNCGTEQGLGPWVAIGLRLSSGLLIELIDHVNRPTRGVEMRVDSWSNLGDALDDALATFGLGQDAVLWRSPLISKGATGHEAAGP